MWRYSLTILTFAAALTSAHADVYKFVDAQGHVQYTDKPETLPAERLNIRSQKTDTVAAQSRSDAEREQMAANDKARQAAAGQKADAQGAVEASAKDRAERCSKARERYDSYMNSQRLYEALPNGERRDLDSAEVDAARASAKVTMEELCKGL